MPRHLPPRVVARLRYRGVVLADRVVRAGAPLTVGEDPRCDFVAPGCGAHGAFRPMLDPPPSTWAPCGGAEGATATRWLLAAHPDVSLEVEPLDADPPPSRGWRGFRPAAADLVAAGTVACLAAIFAWVAPEIGGPGALAPRVGGLDGPVRLATFASDPHASSSAPGTGRVAWPRWAVVPGRAPEGTASAARRPPGAARAEAQRDAVEAAKDPRRAESERSRTGPKRSVPTAGGAGAAGRAEGTLASTEDGGRPGARAEGGGDSDPDPRSSATVLPSITGDSVDDGWFSRCSVSPPATQPIRRAQVVFVLDVSTTMNTALPVVLEAAAAVDRAMWARGAAASADAGAHFEGVELGIVAYVDDAVLVRPRVPWARSFQELAPWLDPILARAGGNVQLTTDTPNYDWPENALDALYLAATGLSWDLRDDTARIAVWVTDDGFADAGTKLSVHMPVRHGYAETVAALSARGVRVVALAARRGGPREDEDVQTGIFAPWNGMRPIPEATAGAAAPLDVLAEGPDRLARVLANVLSSNAACSMRR